MGKTDRSRLRRSVIEIFALACHASNGAESARQWLCALHALLGGASPLDRMDTIVGMEEVTTMLAHVEHGMPVYLPIPIQVTPRGPLAVAACR
jgi:uncharacterized protein (DUF2384 family)